MLKFKENELVYTSFGYGTVLTFEKKNCEPVSLPEKEKENAENSESIPPPPLSLEEIKESEEMEMTHVKLKWGGTVSLPVQDKTKINIFYTS